MSECPMNALQPVVCVHGDSALGPGSERAAAGLETVRLLQIHPRARRSLMHTHYT